VVLSRSTGDHPPFLLVRVGKDMPDLRDDEVPGLEEKAW
jgi:hypothetical protein